MVTILDLPEGYKQLTPGYKLFLALHPLFILDSQAPLAFL